jgi:hypothetical protein
VRSAHAVGGAVSHPNRTAFLRVASARGVVTGLLGVAAMTAADSLEQLRPCDRLSGQSRR